MAQTGWGIIGPGQIAQNFADGLAESASGRLVAIASRSADRRQAFGDRNAVQAANRHSTYAALVADPKVDAVYISTPHPWHAELALMAIRAGKPVLVEKPAGLNAAEVVTIADAARQEGVLFMEAFMYRCHPQIARLVALIRERAIGEVTHIRTAFGFAAPRNAASRLYDPALAGGGILDVGGYPMSLACLVAGVAGGGTYAEPEVVTGTGIIGPTGVDEVAYGLLHFASGITAEIACAVARNMTNSAEVIGTEGRILLPDPWVPGRNKGPSDAVIEVTTKAGTRVETLTHPEHMFTFEAEVASRAVAEGALSAPAPALSPADSIANARSLDRWRQAVGYKTLADQPSQTRRLPRALPKGLPAMRKIAVEGVATPMSQLIMGCDNQDGIAGGAIVWDAWMEAGGNAFDTAFVYGGGLHETVFGQWMASRGVADEVVVIGKGAHTPYCLPGAIEAQLDISLGRLGLDRLPVYIMHRDNPDVPVGEFVDVLNQLHKAGRIGAFGGSNWSVARLTEANAYAAAQGLQPMRFLNNNLSLAVMEQAVWPGCITSHDPATLAYLADTGTVHVSWSSQARGYFLPEALRNRLPPETAPDTCFGSPDNAERRRRAKELAARHGVSANNIALAWVLARPFPSLALVGPRSVDEIATTLPAMGLTLSTAELDWLDLTPGGEAP
ncbi:MAG: aldo/keto reductase [Flavimaricola sp.]|nr:aldo/keto reductase [Flavimaricola sp.]